MKNFERKYRYSVYNEYDYIGDTDLFTDKEDTFYYPEEDISQFPPIAKLLKEKNMETCDRISKQSYYFLNGQELIEEYYAPSQSIELYDDKEECYYNKSGQQLRNPREYQPDEDGCYEPFGDE